MADDLSFNPILEILRRTRDQLARDEAERVAGMGEFERLVHERATAIYTQRLNEMFDEWLFGTMAVNMDGLTKFVTEEPPDKYT